MTQPSVPPAHSDEIPAAGVRAAETAFTAEQFASLFPAGVERHWWNQARNRMLADLLRSEGIGAAGEPLLEIGCGTGVVLAHLRPAGFDAEGCDIADVEPTSAAVAPFVRSRTDALDIDPAERARFRALLFCDVLEHLPDPAAFLGSCLAAYPNARHLAVLVPAGPELWSRYDELLGHYRRYTPRALRALAEELGLRARRVGYSFHALWPPARLLRALGITRSPVFRAPRGPAAVAHEALARAFVLERRLLPPWVRGSSAYLIAERG